MKKEVSLNEFIGRFLFAYLATAVPLFFALDLLKATFHDGVPGVPASADVFLIMTVVNGLSPLLAAIIAFQSQEPAERKPLKITLLSLSPFLVLNLIILLPMQLSGGTPHFFAKIAETLYGLSVFAVSTYASVSWYLRK